MPASSNKTIVKNTLFMYFRMFVTMIVSLYTVRVVLRTLGVVDYGVYGVIGGVVATFGFITDVLANASQRFFAVELGRKDSNRLQQVFGLIVFAYIITAVVVLILAETVGLWFVNHKADIPLDRMGAASFVFQFSVATFLLGIITSPFNAMIIAKECMNIYAYVSILQAFLKLGIVYLLVILPYDKLKLYSLLAFLVVLFIDLIYILVCRRLFPETKFSFQWNKDIFKSIFGYSSWTLLGSAAFICNTQGLNILLNLFFGPIANAAYSIGNQVKSTVNSFAANFFVATRPPMIKSYSEGDYAYTSKLFYFSTKAIFSLLFVLIVPLFAEVEFILGLWLGDVKEYMPAFVRLMLVYAIILSISEPITAIVQAAGKVKLYHGVVDTFTLLTLPLSYIAFKLGMSPNMGFIISIIIFVIAHFMRLFIIRSFYSFSIAHYMRYILLPFALAVVVTSAVIFGIRFILTNSVVMIVLSVILASLSIWLFVFNREERAFVIDIVKSKLSKKHA